METVDDLVIGAGIAGLATAWQLARQGRTVKVLEASGRAGGLIRTVRRGGLVLEQGPQTLQAKGPILRLVEGLGLVDEVVEADAAAARRFVLRDGRLVALPHGLASLGSSPLFTKAQVLRLFAEPLQPRGHTPGETVHAFVSRRMGRAVADELIDPFFAGVFGGDPREVEVDSAFPDLVAWEAEHGSVVRGAMKILPERAKARPSWSSGAIFALRGGNQRLVDALAEALGEAVVYGARVQSLVQRTATRWEAGWHAGDVAARRVWWCADPEPLGRLLGEPVPAAPRSPLAAVSLVYARADLAARPHGFGWLAPSFERDDVLGCLWVSSIFPGHAPGRAMLRVMVGGTRRPSLVQRSAPELVDHARRILADVQGITAEPELTDVMVAQPGIPQYPPGHAAAVEALQARHVGLTAVNWALTGIGVSHTIAAAERLTGAGPGV